MLLAMPAKTARACALEETTRAMETTSASIPFDYSSPRVTKVLNLSLPLVNASLVFLLRVCLDDLPTLLAEMLAGFGHDGEKTENPRVGWCR
jgi:hypothetical protein